MVEFSFMFDARCSVSLESAGDESWEPVGLFARVPKRLDSVGAAICTMSE